MKHFPFVAQTGFPPGGARRAFDPIYPLARLVLYAVLNGSVHGFCDRFPETQLSVLQFWLLNMAYWYCPVISYVERKEEFTVRVCPVDFKCPVCLRLLVLHCAVAPSRLYSRKNFSYFIEFVSGPPSAVMTQYNGWVCSFDCLFLSLNIRELAKSFFIAKLQCLLDCHTPPKCPPLSWHPLLKTWW